MKQLFVTLLTHKTINQAARTLAAVAAEKNLVDIASYAIDKAAFEIAKLSIALEKQGQ